VYRGPAREEEFPSAAPAEGGCSRVVVIREEVRGRGDTERGRAMASFVTLAKFTEQGIKNVNQTTKRAEAFREMAKKMGATVKELYWTLGRYDVVVSFEAPDDETATRLMLTLGALGNVRTETLRAYSAQEMGQVLKGIK
jgi:uncharacterized protein with GYD domain